MTKAKITAAQGYPCAPDGHTVITIPCGTVVEGQIAEWALADRCASRLMGKAEPLENKSERPPENKKRRRK